MEPPSANIITHSSSKKHPIQYIKTYPKHANIENQLNLEVKPVPDYKEIKNHFGLNKEQKTWNWKKE